MYKYGFELPEFAMFPLLDVPALMYVGIVGPRGDAYSLNQQFTAQDAEEYHSTQMRRWPAPRVDLVEAMTFNSSPEAVGVARAASRAGLAASISFTLDSNDRLHSGPSLKQAIESVDDLASPSGPSSTLTRQGERSPDVARPLTSTVVES